MSLKQDVTRFTAMTVLNDIRVNHILNAGDTFILKKSVTRHFHLVPTFSVVKQVR